MNRLILTAILALATGAASAHPSLVAHEHPHGASALMGLDLLALVGLWLLAAAGVALAAMARSKSRSR